MDEVYSVPSYKGAPRGRRRGWPETRPTPVSSPHWWLAAGASALRGRPYTVEPPWLRPPVAYGEIWCIDAEHGYTPGTDAETSDPPGPPIHRAVPARGPGPRHTLVLLVYTLLLVLPPSPSGQRERRDADLGCGGGGDGGPIIVPVGSLRASVHHCFQYFPKYYRIKTIIEIKKN